MSAVCVAGACLVAGSNQFDHAGKARRAVNIQDASDAVSLRQLQRVNCQTEPGHIRGRVAVVDSATSRPILFSWIMDFTAAASVESGHFPARLAVVTNPVPSSFVRTSASPGLAPRFVSSC